jgi:uncharacterized NAD(P)/FAD-binding protein YdhS
VQLVYRAPALKIAILDKGLLPSRGVAYGTGYKYHLLNLPANQMSAFPEQPEHFVGWARANFEPSVQARSFLPRSMYGRYMESLLRHATAIRAQAAQLAEHLLHVLLRHPHPARLAGESTIEDRTSSRKYLRI